MTTYYSKEHEWIRVEGDTATVGITDFAQGQLGDVVFVDAPVRLAGVEDAHRLARRQERRAPVAAGLRSAAGPGAQSVGRPCSSASARAPPRPRAWRDLRLLRPFARGIFVVAIALSVGVQAVGAFWYTGISDELISSSGAASMDGAWDPKNVPFVTELRHPAVAGELLCDANGRIDQIGTTRLRSAEKLPELEPGAVLAGWALACSRTPAQVVLLGSISTQFGDAKPVFAAGAMTASRLSGGGCVGSSAGSSVSSKNRSMPAGVKVSTIRAVSEPA
mgnify:CR=1 FL=1